MQKMPAEMQVLAGLAAGSQIAGGRDCQEDIFQMADFSGDGSDELLLILADGMGGHIGGAYASKLAVGAFTARFKGAAGDGRQRLMASLEAANAAIGEAAAAEPRYAAMGCTLLACLVADDTLYWLSVGDSPLWLLRKNKMIRLNADHSMRPVLQDLVEQGRVSADAVEEDSWLHQLRSALIGKDIAMIDQNKAAFSLVAADQLILASDGLETLTVDEIGSICGEYNLPEKAVAALLGEVEARQDLKQDNATVVIYRHTSAAAKESIPDSRLEAAEIAFREAMSKKGSVG